jgi:nitrogen fixation NifU-like protein
VNNQLRELYQQVILDHGKKPRNFRELEGATHHAEGFNPLCGDRVRLDLRVEDGIIQEAAFQGAGCAISTASASMMTQALKGRSLAEVEAIFEQFHDLVAGKDGEDGAGKDLLGKLEVFCGVKEYPTRVKCAVLVWHTLKSALEEKEDPVSTE